MPASVSPAPYESVSEISAKATDELGLDELLYEMAHRNAKPCKALGDESGIGYTTLMAAVDVHNKQPFHLRWLLPLMRATNDYRVLQLMARACGKVLHDAPVTACSDPVELIAGVASISSETGDVFRTASEVLRDKVVSPADARALGRELDELLEVVHRVREQVRQMERKA